MARQSKSEAPKPPAGGSAASKKGLAIGVVLLVVVIAAAAIAYQALAPAASRDSGQITTSAASSSAVRGESASSGAASSSSAAAAAAAPDFTVTDGEGVQASLSQFRGAPVVVNFWASTCGPCQREMPEFQKAFEQHGDQVQFMMVDIPGFNGETEARAKRFIADNGYTFPVFFDSDGDAAVTYGLTSIPRTLFIDAEGNIVANGAGMLDEASLRRGMDMLLS